MKVKRFFSGVALSLLSLLLVLAAAEFVLRYFPAVDNSYVNSSAWYQAKWYDSHRHSAEKFSYVIDEYHPLYGWVLKAGLNNFPFIGYNVSSSAHHTRIFTTADTGKLKILAIGDSFTFGECVNDSESYPAQLQGIVPGSQVINAGMHGWGYDQMLLRLQNEAKEYKPSVVIIACFNDNLLRNYMWFRDYAKPYFTLENDSLVLNGTPVATPEQLLSAYRLKLLDFVSSRLGAAFGEVTYTDVDPLSQKILSRMIEECRKLNAVPVFLYLPWQQECFSGKSEPAKVFEQLRSRENILWIDPTDSIHQAIRNMPNAEGQFECHYSPYINGVVAAVIQKQLAAQKIIAE